MPDRPFPAVDSLIRRAQRVAAGRPDPARILAQTTSMACPGDADPYAVLGLLIEGMVQTLVQHIPKERRAETLAMLKQLLEERMKACGVPNRNSPDCPKIMQPLEVLLGRLGHGENPVCFRVSDRRSDSLE